MSGGYSGGHFIGFVLALVGLVALLVAVTRPRIAKQLGRRRPFVVAGALVFLVSLALFGSGKRREVFRTAVGPSFGVPKRVEQADVDAALAIALEPAFLEYVAALEGAERLTRPEALRRVLAVRAGTTVDLREEGFQISPPPALGESWLLVSYLDEENAVFAAFDGGEAMRRMILAQHLVQRALPEVTWIVKARAAATDEDKRAVLLGSTILVPRAAEWLARELDEMTKNASPALAEVIARKRAFVQQYIDDPTLRALPAGTKLAAPARR